MTKPKVIAVVGPTASGKTSLGIFLAQHIGSGPTKLRRGAGEVISADSRQVYRGLDLGTGKVTKDEMAGVPHYLLDVCSPKNVFSASDFVEAGERAIEKILGAGHVPIVVGGTGLYADCLLGRMFIPNVPPDEELRLRLEQFPIERLFEMLQKKDPRRAATIEPKHKRRIIRALEIAEALGENPLPNPEQKYDVLWLGIDLPEAKLHKNISVRLDQRLADGMVDEGRRLHAKGLAYKRMQELGLEYGAIARLLKKEVTPQVMQGELERDIRHYAKRQMRWFRRNEHIHWIKNKTEALRLAKAFVAAKPLPRSQAEKIA